MVSVEDQLEKLSLKDGDILIFRSDNPRDMEDFAESCRSPSSPKDVTIWFLFPGESLEVLDGPERERLKELLNG